MFRSFKALRLLVLLLLVPHALTAQQKPEPYRILGIAVEGQTTADPQSIIANTGLKAGDEIVVPGDQTRSAILRLYQLRLFDDVQILIANRTQEGVYLLIKVVENPRLEDIVITGNDELGEDDIRDKINLIKGQVVTKQDLATVVRLLKDEYANEGFLNAQITPTLVAAADTASRRRNLNIEIEEGKEVSVAEIRFHGNKVYDAGDLEGEMEETSSSAWWQFWATNSFNRKKYEEDKALVIKYYRNNGYRDAEILTDSISYDAERENLMIDVYMYEGPQYKIRNITWEGNTRYPASLLTARLGFEKGDVYNQDEFQQNLFRNESESDVASLYQDNGYLMFQVVPEEVRVGEDSLDLIMRVREGNQFRIRQIQISGNTKTYEKVIRRELQTRPGDTFSRQAIIRSIRQLAQLNYFNPEKILPDYRIVDDKTVDLEYKVEEKSSDTFNMSVGYSGAFGFNGGLGVTFNNFAISNPLRGGAGQILNFDYQFGEANRYRTFSIGFTEPWMFDTPLLFGVSVFDTRQVYFYDLRITGGSLRVGRRFKWPDYLFRGDWTLRYQYNDVINGGGLYPVGRTTQMSIAQVISRNSTDSPIFPTLGSNFSLLTELSGGPLPGAADYGKVVLNVDFFIPLGSNQRLTLALLSAFGGIFGIGEDPYIPPQELFYMGGTGLGQFSTTPLRGYEDRSVGPRYSPTGPVFGGQAMMKYVLELRFALTLNPIPIYLLAFTEAGNVWADPFTIDPYDLRRAAGFGARLLINPIGLIGFDYAVGLDPYQRGAPPPGWRFHIQFGKGF